MSLSEAVRPVRMRRVAVVAPQDALRDVLVAVARAGVIELEAPVDPDAPPGEAAERLHRMGATAAPALSRDAPDLDALERAGRADLLAGEAQLAERARAAVRRGSVAGLAGWCPADSVPEVAGVLAPLGAALVAVPGPRGVDPPTLLPSAGRLHRSFEPLVDTYGTPAYRDVDPTLLAGISYVVMFGMMFGDLGHGLLLVAAALLVRTGRPRRFASLRRVWPFLAGAGLAAMLFGLLYGEFFGPTGVLPVLWLSPLDEPVRLLLTAVAFGAVLLAGSYAVGTVNRWREGGARAALYAPSGIAGSALFLGAGLVVAGVLLPAAGVLLVGAVLAVTGLVLAGIGLFTGSGGGVAGGVQTGVELFDLVVRLGSNVVSFARLAAFGMTHAALGSLVWTAAVALTGGGALLALAGVVVFVAGNALAFSLEALVAGVQAMRLEFYELFSRVFEIQGRPFRPWRLPVQSEVSS
ncbi:MAG TPA: V-type ATPase 116kDa subunit family protein [Actinophytocola sp.]|uniref:V-type ATPase 116kDa subunit family protein n=1 Tax=Actinophytocola sp. TaxID=1872138 RepID=UPI002DBC8148|nr:V-type ATPase 116kDa subunit family protein [Actinophytocola sp.]HEU5469317.1 V-type ATPase 116kDa subunit family protein [Actinophytocola sp.]